MNKLALSCSSVGVQNVTKPLEVLAYNNEPYVYINDKGIVHNGIEYYLVKTISEKLNQNLSLIAGTSTRFIVPKK